jgi:iron complex outermembrane receptor protein
LSTTLIVCLPDAASAQASHADDAFGQRTGVEQAGIYNEGAARGFDLGNSNVYRIEDTFFVRTAPLPDPLISRVSVKAGVSAARTSFPSPSGIVEYSFRKPSQTALTLATGYRAYWSPFVDLNASAIEGKLAVSGGALIQPDTTFADGTRGAYGDFAGVARLSPNDRLTVTGFASHSTRRFGGSFGFTASGPELPEVPPISDSFSPPWAKYRARLGSHGLILSTKLPNGLSATLSAHRSTFSPSISDFTLLRLTEDGKTFATLFRTGPRRVEGIAKEALVERRFESGPLRHRLFLAVRDRRSSSRSSASNVVQLGQVDLAELDYPEEPGQLPAQAATSDRIKQRTFTAGYNLQLGDRLELRGGLSSTRSLKTVEKGGQGPGSGRSSYLLPFGSAIWSPSSSLSLFASYVAGLEDSPLAPQGATNANEVLPPVRSEQYEAGARFLLRPGLTASLALFSISKPVPGLDTARLYGFIGEARHRGVEAALAGSLDERTSLLLGAAAIDAKVQRPEGRIVPPGVSQRIGFARLERNLTSQLRLDAQLSHQGPRFLDVANKVRTEGQFGLGAGLRYKASLGKVPAEFRIIGSNLLNSLQWVATASGTLLRTSPRAAHAFVTFSL